MIRILSICGSPVDGSSTEILLTRIAGAVADKLDQKTRHRLVYLNELDLTTCQACGESPAPRFCFIDDDMTGLYDELIGCDCLLFGSPIYFDTVSAQAKAFIDRCNCLKPPVFGESGSKPRFMNRIKKNRPGAFVLVGGEQAWFEGARRCLAGFFMWIGVTNEGFLKFNSRDINRAGEVADNPTALAEADKIGRLLAGMIKVSHD